MTTIQRIFKPVSRKQDQKLWVVNKTLAEPTVFSGEKKSEFAIVQPSLESSVIRVQGKQRSIKIRSYFRCFSWWENVAKGSSFFSYCCLYFDSIGTDTEAESRRPDDWNKIGSLFILLFIYFFEKQISATFTYNSMIKQILITWNPWRNLIFS